MKRFTYLFSLLIWITAVNAQTVPDLIPPSPSAISMVQYGNTGVSFYTGQPSLSVPIHTISVRGYQFPISLSYSGFQGVNLESIAPWTGLGWSLNATGTVSRSIRGKADDDQSDFGYLHVNLPTNTNTTEGQQFVDGIRDGQPDQFHYSVNGMSGSFMFNKNGSTVSLIEKPKSNHKIEYNSTSNITTWTITDTNGYVYTFSELEKTKSIVVSTAQTPTVTNFANSPDNTTSWYLTNIKDQKGNILLTFTYETITGLIYRTYSPRSEKSDFTVFNSSDMSYSDHYLTAKRIKEITYPGGKVKFNLSTGTRQDYKYDKYLQDIEIFDGEDNKIKEYVLSYSYFDENGITAINATPTNITYNGANIGDYKKRLKLDQVQEWNNNGTQSLPPYIFEYNTTNNLAHRYSFASDHWGYYNGETSNTSPEPYYRAKYYVIGNNDPSYVEIGAADKWSDATMTQAGVLKKVTYPTGGYTEFEMEGNTAVDDELPNAVTSHGPTNIKIDNSNHNINNVTLIAEPFVILNFNGITSKNCDVSGGVYRQSDNSQVKSFTINRQLVAGSYSYDEDVYLEESGDFYITLDYIGNCSYTNITDGLDLRYKDEVTTTNKAVGGLRVKSIKDHDGISSANDIVRNFYYNESGDTGNSTGRVVNAPQYGYQTVYNASTTSVPDMRAFGFIRTIRPHYPLMSTNGSYVGYGKVTVITGDGSGKGKSVYEFSTSTDSPDFYDGYYETPLVGESYYSLGSAGSHETIPLPPVDNRDFLRGLLKKQTDYRWTGSAYEKVQEVSNDYRLTYDLPQDNGETNANVGIWVNAAENNTHAFAEGIIFDGSGSHTRYKRYRIYSGRLDLISTTTKQYNLAGNTSQYLETVNTNYYDDLSQTGTNYFNVSRTTMTDSEGNTQETKYFFPYDNVTEIPALTRTAMLDDKNMISTVLKQESFEGSTKLSTLVTKYAGFNSNTHYLPQQVQTAKGTNALENRVEYNDYDTYGNPVELQQTNGTKIVYLWGYDHTLPVAQIQNADRADVIAAINQTILNNPASDAALRTELQKLRTDPDLKGALVTTMTYLPGVGMTSQTSPNGLTVYYEYDSFGRLKYVKDKDNNILKKNEYAYKVNANTTNN